MVTAAIDSALAIRLQTDWHPQQFTARPHQLQCGVNLGFSVYTYRRIDIYAYSTPWAIKNVPTNFCQKLFAKTYLLQQFLTIFK